MIRINNSIIGPGHPVYIIAEMSANHGNDLDTALDTVQAAHDAGADAIKLQTFRPGSITMDVDREEFKANPDSPWKGQKLFDLYKKTMLPWEWHEPLMKKARQIGIDCFSSPFDLEAVDFLEGLDVPAYKIASFEITDIPLIRKCAATGKPMIISTGIATMEDIQLAIETCKEQDNDQVIILKCTSAYPTPPEEADLIMVRDMKERFGVLTGLSDHTIGADAPSIATALGAVVIEKHFKLNDKIESADAGFSMNMNEFADMVNKVRHTETLLGKVDYELDDKKSRQRIRRRSLYISQDVQKGEKLSPENIRSIRPGEGLHPKYYDEILGQFFKEDYTAGTPLSLSMIQKDKDR